MLPPPTPASSARWSPLAAPLRDRPGPAPFLLLFSLGSGRPQRRVFTPPPPHAAPSALSPPPTHLARWPSPRGPAPPRQEGRTLFAPVRPPLPASAAWSVRSGERGAGAGGGGRRRPRAAAAAQPPRARAPIAHSHLSWNPTFPPSFFFRIEPATRARRRREETRSRSPAHRHAPSCPPSPPPPTPAAQQKAIYMRGSDPQPDRAPPPPPAPRTQAKVGAPGGARDAGSGPADGDTSDRAQAALRSCAGPDPRPPSPLAPHTPNSSLPTPRAAPARSDFLPPPPLPQAPGELSRSPGRSFPSTSASALPRLNPRAAATAATAAAAAAAATAAPARQRLRAPGTPRVPVPAPFVPRPRPRAAT
ncbi:uncharacterized protein [Saccopteryx bilineata]|uniref:uncharacterized protein n=1 Tax=Saccopteryx bilineata TaxID=59482 RepID=UPI00338E81F6